MNKILVFWIAVLMLFIGSTTIWISWKMTKPTVGSSSEVDPQAAPPGSDEPILKEFTLTERSGKGFRSRDMEGQVWVASFFFSSCPGSCLRQNNLVMSLQNEFGPKGVKFVSITCDPQQDTPEQLRQYADGFNAQPDQWYFLTGDLTYIRRIGGEIFQLMVMERTHMDRFAVVDKWGKVRDHFDWTDPVQLEGMKRLLDRLLEEDSPPDGSDAEAEATT